METIHLIARFKIHDGKQSEFKKWSKEVLAKTKNESPGPLYYEWFYNEAGTECVVREAYKDSDAMFIHMGNLGDLLGQGLAMADFFPEVYGNLSPELLAAAAPLNPMIYTFDQGL